MLFILPLLPAPKVVDSSDDSDNETAWKQECTHEIIGSEAGAGLHINASYIPVPGGPFSALVATMWPQDILGCIQQVDCFFIFHEKYLTNYYYYL